MSFGPKTLEEARKHHYGRTYGSKERKSDFVEGQCIAAVHFYIGRFGDFKQCTRKAVVDGCWCKQHDPAAIRKRDLEKQKEEKLQNQIESRRWWFKARGEKFYDALKAIADGHNDARQLAKEVLEKAGEVPHVDI